MSSRDCEDQAYELSCKNYLWLVSYIMYVIKGQTTSYTVTEHSVNAGTANQVRMSKH